MDNAQEENLLTLIFNKINSIIYRRLRNVKSRINTEIFVAKIKYLLTKIKVRRYFYISIEPATNAAETSIPIKSRKANL